MRKCPHWSAATRAPWTRLEATSVTQSLQTRSVDWSNGSIIIRDTLPVTSSRLITLQRSRFNHRILSSVVAMWATANSWSVWPSTSDSQPWATASEVQNSSRFVSKRVCYRRKSCIEMKVCNSEPSDPYKFSRSSSAWFLASWSYLKISRWEIRPWVDLLRKKSMWWNWTAPRSL